jgi:hypothetical protein
MDVVDVVIPWQRGSNAPVVISTWKTRAGESVTEGETIVILETAHGMLELDSPVTGVVDAVLSAEGDKVHHDHVIAKIRAATRINILSFFQDEAKRDEERVSELQERAAQTKSKLPTLEAEIAATKSSIADKSKFQVQAETEGLDTTKLLKGIAELQTRHDTLVAQVESCRRELDSASPTAKTNFEPSIELAHTLASNFHCSDATEVGELRDCYAYVDVQITDHDDHGGPITIGVRMGGKRGVNTLNVVNPAGRVSKDFRPDSLSWLPQTRKLEERYLPEIAAFLKPTSGAIWLSTTNLSGSNPPLRRLQVEAEIIPTGVVRRRPPEPLPSNPAYRAPEPWAATKQPLQVNPDLAVALDEHAMEKLGHLEPIDLSRSYPENELAELVRTRVLAQTVASTPYMPMSEHLSSAQVSAKIQADWAAFVNCPWARDIDDDVALLKYHAENGERPRFWSEEFEGHFGFRLRTRDHSWLTGQVFIMPGGRAPDGESRMQVRERGVASLGRFHLKVSQS